MPEAPRAGRPARGVLLAAFATAFALLSLSALPIGLARAGSGDWESAGVWLLGWLIGVPVGTGLVFLVCLLPALAFHRMAERLGWRHPLAYTGAGGGTGAGVFALFTTVTAGDASLIPAYAILGLLGGTVFWWTVVRPLRGAAISPKSGL